jgi:4-hydroxybenzoate polyprenyltransferase
MKKIFTTIRANDWWEYKLPPMLAVAYLIIQKSNHTFLSQIPLILLTLSAIILCAIYVSLINDATDVEDDAKAGKKNQMAAYNTIQQIGLILLPVVGALGIVIFFLKSPIGANLFYLGSYIAFTLYSVPPFRLKKRGIAGIMADALGSQVFPTLFIALCFYQSTNQQIQTWSIVCMAIWLFCFGLRGILWHQLADKENDKVSGLVTVVQKLNDAQLVILGNCIVAIELAAFAAFVWFDQLFLIIPGLVFYFIYNWLLLKKFSVQQIYINPNVAQYRIFLFEYYQVFLPLSILIVGTFNNPINIIALLLHFFLFPSNTLKILRNIRASF